MDAVLDALSYTQVPPDPFHSGDWDSGGYVYFNDDTMTPDPNRPRVGDVNGDGLDDIVRVGEDTTPQEVFVASHTVDDGSDKGVLGTTTDSWVGVNPDHYAFFVGDVGGDGYDDAIAVKDNGSGGMFWEAFNSDDRGLSGTSGSSSSLAEEVGNTPLVGDFNGDGRIDIGQRLTSGLPNYVHVWLSASDGSGLKAAPTIEDVVQGQAEDQPNFVAMLVGDVNGDGMDDIVAVDDRNSTGQYVWVAYLTGPDGGAESGLAIGAGGMSWAFPFGDSTPSADFQVPMLADLNGDVDLSDFAMFQSCFTGEGDPGGRFDSLPYRCRCMDDGDLDIDQHDYAVFENCFAGPGILVDRACDD